MQPYCDGKCQQCHGWRTQWIYKPNGEWWNCSVFICVEQWKYHPEPIHASSGMLHSWGSGCRRMSSHGYCLCNESCWSYPLFEFQCGEFVSGSQWRFYTSMGLSESDLTNRRWDHEDLFGVRCHHDNGRWH